VLLLIKSHSITEKLIGKHDISKGNESNNPDLHK
jgi:hypothetical protein